MATLDVPEMLIALAAVASLAWALYNWANRHPGSQKKPPAN